MNNPLNPSIAKIADVSSDTGDVKTFTIRLKKPFELKSGQFNMIGYPGIGEAPISISSLLKGGCIEHTIRSVGRVTDFLFSLKKGDEVFIRGPYGRGWPIEEAERNDLVIVAGGLGLAPLRPVVHEVIKKRGLFDNVTLIYGARDENNVIYLEEIETWVESGINVSATVDKVINPREWKYKTGSVMAPLDSAVIGSNKTLAFICGPEIMMRFACSSLLMRGLSASRLYVSLERRMKCGIGHCGHCQHGGRFVCKEGPVFSYREMRGLPDGMF